MTINPTRAATPSGAEFKAARVAAGETVEACAYALGVAATTVTRYESGRVSRPSTHIARAFTLRYAIYLSKATVAA